MKEPPFGAVFFVLACTEPDPWERMNPALPMPDMQNVVRKQHFVKSPFLPIPEAHH
jgi:hypothetical protein